MGTMYAWASMALAAVSLSSAPARAERAFACAESVICDSYYSDGVCRDWTTTQICGRFCAQGRECDNRYSDGVCREWRATAACGGDTCVTERYCDSRYSDDVCRDWASRVSCE